MKIFLKSAGFFAVGLLIAAVVYPVLHEAGHLLTAVLVGAKISDFSLLSLACEGDVTCQVFTGLGGIMLPYFLSMSLRPADFWLCYSAFVLKGISVFSVFVSMLAIIFDWQNDDVVQVLHLFPKGTYLFVSLFAVMLIYGVLQLTKDGFLSKVYDYFNNLFNKMR